MENSRLDDTKLIAIIGLLISVLIVVSVLFGIAYFYDIKHNPEVDVGSCYKQQAESSL
ncbi:hypothetical protein [Acerihabitans arboris]|uniref:hypothetical protein n=1 Tax=Acerihabitans arboris TaxID=2691583 RepID=UPI0015B3A16A|nr:hypothetical protein [Acerihabitans arboris]